MIIFSRAKPKEREVDLIIIISKMMMKIAIIWILKLLR
jgi:hypothetical protein